MVFVCVLVQFKEAGVNCWSERMCEVCIALKGWSLFSSLSEGWGAVEEQMHQDLNR